LNLLFLIRTFLLGADIPCRLFSCEQQQHTFETKKEMITQVIHWLSYCYFLYLFGYASLFKVFQKKEMMEGMRVLGFDKTWTTIIGVGELIGVVALIAGLWFHQLKNAAVIYLLPFAVGALMVHFAHKDYKDFYDALFGVITAVVLLVTDKHFKISL
jgi:uncharacterized membrane protein YphA (DoxX/SURF4 family)